MTSPVLIVTRKGKIHLASLESNKGVPASFIGADNKTYTRVPWASLDCLDNPDGITEVYEESE